MSPRRVLLSVGSLCALMASFLLGPVDADQAVYTDSLQSGWVNYSWATVNFSATSPVHGGADSISVQSGAYQALYLHHPSQPTAPFVALTFWINGGPAGGQRLQVQATLGGSPQPAYALPVPQANTWTQVTIPLSALGVAGQTNFDGFWIQDTSGAASSPVYFVDDMALVSTLPSAAIKVDAGANRHPISPLIYGVAYGDAAGLADLNAPLNRQGGNNTTRYNWQLNADNRASDYFFESIGDSSTRRLGSEATRSSRATKSGGRGHDADHPHDPLRRQPGAESRQDTWTASPSSQVRPAAESTDPYFPDAGNGVNWRAAGTSPGTTRTTPTWRTAPAFEAGWINHIVGAVGPGGVLGRPEILPHGQRAEPLVRHPPGRPPERPRRWTRSLNDIVAYSGPGQGGGPVGAAWSAPEEWGWDGYFYSGLDQQYGAGHGYAGRDPDRNGPRRHGLHPLPAQPIESRRATWRPGKRLAGRAERPLLPAGRASSATTRLHSDGAAAQPLHPPALGPGLRRRRAGSTPPSMLIPRLHRAGSAPTTPARKTAITEYNWGADGQHQRGHGPGGHRSASSGARAWTWRPAGPCPPRGRPPIWR